MSLKIPDWVRYEIRQRWERLTTKQLALREWINRQNPKVAIGITCVSVFTFLVIVVRMLSGPETAKVKESKKAWFYDLNTGELFVAKSNAVPPIEAPSGPLSNGRQAGVKAYVFTYAYEPNELDYFIGFLEIPDPQAQEDTPDSAKSAVHGVRQWGRGKLIRRVEDKQWVPGDSMEGRAILKEIFLPNKNGEHPRYCPPK